MHSNPRSLVSFREEAGFKTTSQLPSLSHLEPLPPKGPRGRARTHTHAIKHVSKRPFSKGAGISAPEPESALSLKRTNFPNVMTSAHLTDLDQNTTSPVNGLYLSGSTKKKQNSPGSSMDRPISYEQTDTRTRTHTHPSYSHAHISSSPVQTLSIQSTL